LAASTDTKMAVLAELYRFVPGDLVVGLQQATVPAILVDDLA
jgi:hypothetical protein